MNKPQTGLGTGLGGGLGLGTGLGTSGIGTGLNTSGLGTGLSTGLIISLDYMCMCECICRASNLTSRRSWYWIF